MKKPKNQHQQTLYYLYNLKEFSLKDLIIDSMFYKFQTRLGEIESEHGSLATKTRIKFNNRFGNKASYTKYKCIDKNRVLEIYSNYD